MELQPIVHVWLHKDDDLVDLTITTSFHAVSGKTTNRTTEVIHTNKKHPFLTMEKGFLPVGQIKIGMHVLRADGLRGVITGWKLVPGVVTMYNLEVAQDHTFVVGVGQWVVHNCGKSFPNLYPESLQSELEVANQLGVKPLQASDPGFQEMIQNGTAKWAVSEEGKLAFVPKWVGGEEIKHSVITGGKNVLAAGEADIINIGNGFRAVRFNRWSGHFQPDEASEIIGREAFNKAGIQFPPPFRGLKW